MNIRRILRSKKSKKTAGSQKPRRHKQSKSEQISLDRTKFMWKPTAKNRLLLKRPQKSTLKFCPYKTRIDNWLKKSKRSKSRAKSKPKTPPLTKNSFNFNMIIGKGGFGKVWVVDPKQKQKRYYALKVMDKARIIQKNSVKSVMNE